MKPKAAYHDNLVEEIVALQKEWELKLNKQNAKIDQQNTKLDQLKILINVKFIEMNRLIEKGQKK